MSTSLLTTKDLSVNVEEKEILHNINLEIGKGETHVLIGPNGAGKSTLGYALMGTIQDIRSQTAKFISMARNFRMNLRINVRRKEFSFLSRIRWRFRESLLLTLSAMLWNSVLATGSVSGISKKK